MEDKQIFIPKDSLVKVYLKNGLIIEGIVLAWNNQKGLLRSPEGSNQLIICNPIKNVIMIKLLIPETDETKEFPKTKQIDCYVPEQVESVSETQSCNLYPQKSSLESIQERTKRLIKYRLSQTSSEKKMIAQTLAKSSLHEPLDFSKQLPNIKTQYYEPPNFTQYRSILDSRKKNR